VRDDRTSGETVQAFAQRLEAFAAQLSDRERQALESLVLRAMDPLERISLRDPGGLLEPHEEALLQEIESETSQVRSP
jgi:hypothetical protein